MQLTNAQLLQILIDNPHLIAVYNSPPNEPHQVTAIVNENCSSAVIIEQEDLKFLKVDYQHSQPLQIRITTDFHVLDSHPNRKSQDEPIQLGCLIQPAGANWVGTAGSPVTWKHPNGNQQFGILSNWHVMASGREKVGRTQHQPDISQPEMARLTAWTPVSPHGTNRVDAAIANALEGDFHTITNEIIGIGKIKSPHRRATIGDTATKSGRTSGVTIATCQGTGAAVRVGYGDFEAAFVDQDVYHSEQDPFSAPGDSGSLIIATKDTAPLSLLFAGSSTITIGNPAPLVAEAFNLTWL